MPFDGYSKIKDHILCKFPEKQGYKYKVAHNIFKELLSINFINRKRSLLYFVFIVM